MKKCMICGNKNSKELEPVTLHSDGDGNDAEISEWMCKEGKGCSK